MPQESKTPQIEPVWKSSLEAFRDVSTSSHCILLSPFTGCFVVPVEKAESEQVFQRKDHSCFKLIQVFPHTQFFFAFVLTVFCPFCRFLQYLGLEDHLDLGHIAKSKWIIKLEKRTKMSILCGFR